MSRTLNKVMLIGNVGKEPELRYTPSGIPVANFMMDLMSTMNTDDNHNCNENNFNNDELLY